MPSWVTRYTWKPRSRIATAPLKQARQTAVVLLLKVPFMLCSTHGGIPTALIEGAFCKAAAACRGFTVGAIEAKHPR